MYILHGQILKIVTSWHLQWPISELLEMQIELWVTVRIKIKNVRETVYNTPVRPQLEYAAPIWDPYTKEKHSSLKKSKEGPHDGPLVIMITGQASLTSSVGDSSSKDERMPAFASFTTWSMELWQYLSQTTSSPHIECSVTPTQ